MTSTADLAAQLDTAFGLAGMELRYGLTQDELFHEAIANDRGRVKIGGCLLYTSPSPRDQRGSRMPSSA